MWDDLVAAVAFGAAVLIVVFAVVFLFEDGAADEASLPRVVHFERAQR